MGRCARCNVPDKDHWDTAAYCDRCDFPRADIRTDEQISEDDKDIAEFYGEEE